MPAFRPTRLLAAGLVVVMAGLGVPARAADHSPGQPSPSGATQARQALSEARSLFARSASVPQRRAAQASGNGADATLVLRDLALRADDLPTLVEREAAHRLLARPTTQYDPTGGYEPKYTSPDGITCGPHICVHWVEDATVDSVQGAGAGGNDGDLSTVPTQVSQTLATMEHVYDVEVSGYGYDAPLGDGTRGGDARTDVYLADLGSDGLYGYCASDDPASTTGVREVFAYCVLDNDYRAGQYGTTHTPLENLEVTAAHEYFHSVQFGYDATEDLWLMEGTAAWMEDEVYDSVNDNLQYLGQSALRYPGTPLDYSDDNYLSYGSWIFWKYLSEQQGAGSADDPSVIRQVWEAARGSRYSTAALESVLVARGSSFADAFSRFGTWTRNPQLYFSEGSSYPAATLSNSFTLTSASRTTGQRLPVPDHMTHRFYRITPGATLTGRWRLHVAVNMADEARGSIARVVLHRQDGSLAAYGVPLNSAGNGSRNLDFRRTVVKYAELELVNASIRFRCDQNTYQSCQGVGLDDNLTAVFNATAVRY